MSTLTVVRHAQARPFREQIPTDLSMNLGEQQRRRGNALAEYWAQAGVQFDEVLCGSLAHAFADALPDSPRAKRLAIDQQPSGSISRPTGMSTTSPASFNPIRLPVPSPTIARFKKCSKRLNDARAGSKERSPTRPSRLGPRLRDRVLARPAPAFQLGPSESPTWCCSPPVDRSACWSRRRSAPPSAASSK